MPLTPLVRSYDQLILDLDGSVWIGGEPTPRAPEAIAALREAGKRIAFVTNNSRLSAEEYVRELWGIGVQASAGDVVTVGGAMQHLLAETRQRRTAFVIGTQAMVDHVADAGLKVLNGTDLASRSEVVVLAGTDELTYEDLRVAALAVRRGADLLATSRDPTYPRPDGPAPGTGAILAAVETASGRAGSIVGKPEPQLLLTALDRLGEARTLVVGDRLDADIAAANRVGLDAVLVMTGTDPPSDEQIHDPTGPHPIAVADNLGALVLGPEQNPAGA